MAASERPVLSPPPFPHRWFEDFTVGVVFAYGGITVTEQKILEFGREYDPEPFHTDPGRARRMFGGLIASGVQTAAWWRRMNFDAFPAMNEEGTSGVSPGWDEIRWRSPVRPGDVLWVESEVVEARPLKSRPGMGLLRLAHEMRNQHRELRQTHTSLVFRKMRPT